MSTGQIIASVFLALILLAGIVILVLFYTDRLPFPKPEPERELTEFEKASQELADNINALGREIGKAMEPTLRKMTDAISSFTKSGR